MPVGCRVLVFVLLQGRNARSAIMCSIFSSVFQTVSFLIHGLKLARFMLGVASLYFKYFYFY